MQNNRKFLSFLLFILILLMLEKEKNKNIFVNGEEFPLVDEFYTLQGEGYHFGKAAYFLRLGGCDIGCRWCDTKITWLPETHKII